MKAILLGMALCSLFQSVVHRARVDTQAKDDRLIIQGKFANESLEAEALRSQLTTNQGISGSSRSSQSGRFVAAPDEEVVLSRTSVNINSEILARLN